MTDTTTTIRISRLEAAADALDCQGMTASQQDQLRIARVHLASARTDRTPLEQGQRLDIAEAFLQEATHGELWLVVSEDTKAEVSYEPDFGAWRFDCRGCQYTERGFRAEEFALANLAGHRPYCKPPGECEDSDRLIAERRASYERSALERRALYARRAA